MVDHLNDEDIFEGDVTTRGFLLAEGPLIHGVGGANAGDAVDMWPVQVRVQVANTTERAAVVAWRAANDPITVTRPLLVWRADGSSTGLTEFTVDGVNWVAESPAAGDLEMTMAATAPYGWMLCQGQTLVNAVVNYPALWASASPLFRSGSDLRLPDLRGRIPMGAGTGTGLTLRTLGTQLGAETVVLTEAQMPVHDHTINHDHPDATTNTAGSHTHSRTLFKSEVDVHDHDSGGSSNTVPASAADSGNSSVTSGQNNASGSHNHEVNIPSHTGSSGTAGSGQGHPNIPPAAVVNFKVKI